MKVQWAGVLSDVNVLLGEANREDCLEDWRRPFQKIHNHGIIEWISKLETELVTANLSAGLPPTVICTKKLLCPKGWSG